MLGGEAVELGFDGFHVELPPGVTAFFKARPATEGDKRFIYCEPSTEEWDSQDERILQKALADSADHYLKFGNLDIDHLSLIGPRLGMTPAEAKLYEIGVPTDVRTTPRIMVKGEIYQGEGPGVAQANFFWDSLTKQTPRRRWYPSVGGRPTAPKEQTPRGAIIKAVKWTNIAFARGPVNATVKAVSLSLADFAKAITAGYGTDSASLSGGAALRRESLQGAPIRTVQGGADRDAAHRFLAAAGTGRCNHTATDRPTLASMVEHFRECEGMPPAAAHATAALLVREAGRRLPHKDAHRTAAAAA